MCENPNGLCGVIPPQQGDGKGKGPVQPDGTIPKPTQPSLPQPDALTSEEDIRLIRSNN